jgi:hypothetical protein
MPLPPDDPIPRHGFFRPGNTSPVSLGIIAVLGVMAVLYVLRHAPDTTKSPSTVSSQTVTPDKPSTKP